MLMAMLLDRIKTLARRSLFQVLIHLVSGATFLLPVMTMEDVVGLPRKTHVKLQYDCPFFIFISWMYLSVFYVLQSISVAFEHLRILRVVVA